jgi:hypothetical protein
MSKIATRKPPKAHFILLLMVIGGLLIGLRAHHGFEDRDITIIIDGALSNILGLIIGIPISLKIYELQQNKKFGQ